MAEITSPTGAAWTAAWTAAAIRYGADPERAVVIGCKVLEEYGPKYTTEENSQMAMKRVKELVEEEEDA